eukprot:CAMPEP_0176441730 /NCGR_PEP_ID=MMETSP0127-20121128/21384_1 /TAXON_ID=938130 /ORGANISM="Platyophrya macrostoma, Strain WH" /LENGTH=236 /DNA_ID=CAMNT_0017826589 /DNA_START=8 /DNA_END=718 /DNA_ORIENTATION=+
MDSLKDLQFTEKGNDIYITPKEGKHTETLVFMHGLGDSAKGWFDVFYAKDSPVLKTTKVVLLTAPTKAVTINFGMKMPSWFDIRDFNINADNFETSIGVKEIEENSKRITAVLDQELKELDENSQRLFIGGFSQGACMALHNGLQYPKTLGGILCFSGFGFPVTKETEENKKTPIFISHGEEDQLLPWKKVGSTYKNVETDVRKITRSIIKDLGHGIDLEVLSAANKFFKTALGTQ